MHGAAKCFEVKPSTLDRHTKASNSERPPRSEIQSMQMPAHAVVCVPMGSWRRTYPVESTIKDRIDFLNYLIHFNSIQYFYSYFFILFFTRKVPPLIFIFQEEIVCHQPANGAAIRKNPHTD